MKEFSEIQLLIDILEVQNAAFGQINPDCIPVSEFPFKNQHGQVVQDLSLIHI